MLLLWVLWVAFFIAAQGIVVMIFSFFPPAIPIMSFVAGAMLVFLFLAVGFGTSGALLRNIEGQLAQPVAVAAV